MFMAVFHQHAVYALPLSLQPDVFMALMVLNCGCSSYFGLHLTVESQK